MDQRLVIPKDIPENVLRAIRSGHSGRDAMLREASDMWWQEFTSISGKDKKNCEECQKAGENLNRLKIQKEFGTLPEAKSPKDEISLNFAGPFQNAYKQGKYLNVSVDNSPRWPEAIFLPNPSADSVVEFLVEHIAKSGIPKRIRTDPGTICTGGNSENFVRKDSISR